MTVLELVAIVVRDYDPAIRFFVDILQFELVEDSPAVTTDGRSKRWVVVRPPGAQTGLLRCSWISPAIAGTYSVPTSDRDDDMFAGTVRGGSRA